MKTLKPANMMRQQIYMSVNLKACRVALDLHLRRLFVLPLARQLVQLLSARDLHLRRLFVLPPAMQLVQLLFGLDLHPRLLSDLPPAMQLVRLPSALDLHLRLLFVTVTIFPPFVLVQLVPLSVMGSALLFVLPTQSPALELAMPEFPIPFLQGLPLVVPLGLFQMLVAPFVLPALSLVLVQNHLLLNLPQTLQFSPNPRKSFLLVERKIVFPVVRVANPLVVGIVVGIVAALSNVPTVVAATIAIAAAANALGKVGLPLKLNLPLVPNKLLMRSVDQSLQWRDVLDFRVGIK
jgi:hypothetical protein